MKNKKWILGGGITLVLCFFLVSPGIVGYLAEVAIHKGLSNSSPKDIKHLYINADLQSFQRRWFHSEMKTLFSLEYPFLRFFLPSQEEDQLPKVALQTDTNFYHGPIMYVTEVDGKKHFRGGIAFGTTTAHLTNETEKAIAQNWLGQIPTFLSDYLIRFNGHIFICNYNPAFHLKSIDNTKEVIFGGAKTCADTNGEISDVDNDLSFQQINVKMPSFSMGTNGFNIRYQEKKHMFGEHPLWPGHYELSIPKAWFHSVSAGELQLNNTMLKSVSHLNENWYDLTTDVNVDEIKINGRSFGNLHYLGTFSHFDGPSFSHMRRYITLQSLALPLSEMSSLALAHSTLVAQFLSKEPIYELKNLSLDTPFGSLKAKGIFKATLKPGAMSKLSEIAKTKALDDLYAVNWSFDLQVSKSLAQEGLQEFYRWFYGIQEPTKANLTSLSAQAAQKQLKLWLKQGNLIEKEGLYEAHLGNIQAATVLK